MLVIGEFNNHDLKFYSKDPIVHCKAFEANSGELKILWFPKLQPRIKHINCVYHNFQ